VAQPDRCATPEKHTVALPPDGIPDVHEIDGVPLAVALQQQRGSPTIRSSVGSVTTLSHLLRMPYLRRGISALTNARRSFWLTGAQAEGDDPHRRAGTAA